MHWFAVMLWTRRLLVIFSAYIAQRHSDSLADKRVNDEPLCAAVPSYSCESASHHDLTALILPCSVALAWRDDRLFGTAADAFDPSTSFIPSPEFLNAEDDFSIALDYAVLPAPPTWSGITVSGDATETWVLATGRKVGAFIAELALQVRCPHMMYP